MEFVKFITIIILGKDVRERGRPATDLYRADRRLARYKTHGEQRADSRRSYFTEREIPISGAPQAPPRSRNKGSSKRQSVKDFREESTRSKKLFQSEHQVSELDCI